MLNIIFAIFFAMIGIAGLIYGVEVGVFVGFALFPWQIIQWKKEKILSFSVIVICSLIGSVFLFISREWLLLLFFLFIQGYNYWGSINISSKKNDQ